MTVRGGPNQPRVSICTTNYNCGHALRRHLASVYALFDPDSFEYVCVDNFSRDASPSILDEWKSEYPNFRWVQRRCSMGAGREIAAVLSSAPHILIVDTDTIYFSILRDFVERVLEEYPEHAVQAIYAGVFPRDLWRAVGGRHDLNVGEDFDMWMRIWRHGRMRWYPVPMGQNLKDSSATDGSDYLSGRYSKGERLLRFVRGKVDRMKLVQYRDLDLDAIWRTNSVDLGLGPRRDTWFSRKASGGAVRRVNSSGRSVWEILAR